MSYVQPNWQDVRFNQAAASEAIEQCRSVAAELRRTNQERNGLASLAREGWQGRYRDEFDEDLPSLTAGASTVAALLDALALAIEAAAEGAMQEQGAREQQRQQWRQKQAAESAGTWPATRGLP
ncbi:MAG: hypothetical protein M3O70_22415 [Actinomycetota bacterium]|nr:hypothetical protein [Actinomycetota bacterium]